MDISDLINKGFLKPQHFANGKRQAVIAEVRPGRYTNPDCEFQDGSVLTLNTTNMRTMAEAWGRETAAWTGKQVELYVGKTEFDGEQRDSVLVRTLSPPILKPKGAGGSMDDTPF